MSQCGVSAALVTKNNATKVEYFIILSLSNFYIYFNYTYILIYYFTFCNISKSFII